MVFRINNVDCSGYVKHRGFKRTRNDVDGPDAGRTMDAKMHRNRVATKIRLDITCRPMKQSETQILLPLIENEYVQVTYQDPAYGVVTKTMYSNNNPSSYCVLKSDGSEYWDGIDFPLVEQ